MNLIGKCLIVKLNVLMMMLRTSISMDVSKIKTDSYEMRLLSYWNKSVIDSLRVFEFDDYKSVNMSDSKLLKYSLNQENVCFVFMPKRTIILDRSIDLKQFNFYPTTYITVSFMFVKGFDVSRFEMRSTVNIVNIVISYFSFYKSDLKLTESDQCIESNYPKEVYFYNVKYLSFDFGTKYSAKTCNLIFRNAIAESLSFYGLTRSFVKRNMLAFTSVKSDRPNALNCKVYYGVVYIYKIRLDANLFDKNVFQKSEQLIIGGEVDRVDNDTFKGLRYIKLIGLFVSNIRMLFSRGIDWMKEVNSLAYNMSNEKLVIEYFKWDYSLIQTYRLLNESLNELKLEKPYLYPDEDFCWFVKFPFETLLFLDPHTNCVNGNCSCTQYWLLQYVFYFNLTQTSLDTTNLVGNNYVVFRKYDREIRKCQFERRIKNCRAFKQSVVNEIHPSFQNALIKAQHIDFANVILLPFASTLSIVINIINIRVISSVKYDKSPENMKQKTLLRFMLAYSVINLVHSVIQALSLMSKCVVQDGIYCSDIYYSQFAQYYKIIFVEFLASILKTVSNVMYFCISLNRYILLEKESKIAVFLQNGIIEWSRKKKIIWSLILLVLIIGFNTHKIFIYKVISYSLINIFYDQYIDLVFMLPLFLSNSKSYEHELIYESREKAKTKSEVYEAFTYVNFLLNDVVLFLTFTVIDVLLVVALKKSTDKKKLLTKDLSSSDKLKQQVTELEQTTKKIMRVIIANTLILLVVKSFDFAVAISKFRIWKQDLHLISYNQKLNSFCHTVPICMVYEDLVKILYIFYYSFSMVTFYFLNKNYSLNLKNICCAVCYK